MERTRKKISVSVLKVYEISAARGSASGRLLSLRIAVCLIFVKMYVLLHEFPVEVFHKNSDLILIIWDFYCIINTKSEKKRV